MDIVWYISRSLSTLSRYFYTNTGRTGRAGMKGIATSFLTAADADIMFDLKEFLLANKQAVPHELMTHEAAQNKPGTLKRVMWYFEEGGVVL